MNSQRKIVECEFQHAKCVNRDFKKNKHGTQMCTVCLNIWYDIERTYELKNGVWQPTGRIGAALFIGRTDEHIN